MPRPSGCCASVLGGAETAPLAGRPSSFPSLRCPAGSSVATHRLAALSATQSRWPLCILVGHSWPPTASAVTHAQVPSAPAEWGTGQRLRRLAVGRCRGTPCQAAPCSTGASPPAPCLRPGPGRGLQDRRCGVARLILAPGLGSRPGACRLRPPPAGSAEKRRPWYFLLRNVLGVG